MPTEAGGPCTCVLTLFRYCYDANTMQLNTLGPLRLADATLSRPKPLLLLVYLALEGPKPHSGTGETS